MGHVTVVLMWTVVWPHFKLSARFGHIMIDLMWACDSGGKSPNVGMRQRWEVS